jgi:F0F1-type ATP synthase assembly protein I
MDRPPPRPEGYDLLKYGSLGLEMGAAVVIGLLIGQALDRWLGTAPWLTAFFLVLGFAAAVRSVWRAARSSLSKDQEGPEDDP